MDNIRKLITKMPVDADCAVITSDVNRRYFTGMDSSAGTLLVFRHDEVSYLIIDFRYYEKAREIVKNCTVIKTDDYYSQLTELFKRHNIKKAMIEADTLTVSMLNKLRGNIHNAIFDESSSLSIIINKIRSVKTKDEINKIISAQRIAEKVFENALDFIKTGVTEKQLAYFIDDYMLRNGADEPSFRTIVLSGNNTSVPHGAPSGREISGGEFILMDFGAVYEGYRSDMTRTVCLGCPGDEMVRVYEIVLKAQRLALKEFKAGKVCRDIDAAARNYINDKGYGIYFGHGLGHSAGLEIHESPACNTKDETVLEPGVIMTCEPGIYLPEKFGVRIEDMAVITENGCENITKSPKNLILL